jgi:hypothetical protein
VHPATAKDVSFERLAIWVVLVFGVLMLTGIVGMLRRNLRTGRGDRRGAMVLGHLIFFTLMLALIIRADHTASVVDESRLIVTIAAQALYFAFLTWALYLSFEPYARRRWPGLMISWSRLLAGRVRDPMVGRDLLLGGLGGIVMALVIHLDIALPSGFGHSQHAPLGQVVTPLSATRHLGFFFMINIYSAVGLSLASLIGVFVIQAVVRSRSLAWALQFLTVYLFFIGSIATNPPFSGALALSAAIWYLLLMRVGLLASSAAFYFFIVICCLPLTLDPGIWYAGRTLIGLGVLAGVLFYAFHVALAGKSLIGHWLIESESQR